MGHANYEKHVEYPKNNIFYNSLMYTFPKCKICKQWILFLYQSIFKKKSYIIIAVLIQLFNVLF